MIRVINAEIVRNIYRIHDAIPDMERALTSFSDGTAYQHPRMTAAPPGDDGRILIMPAATADSFGLKMLTMYPRAGERGLPGVQGLVVLVDNVHGEPLALIDGGSVTEIRTAAVSALATDRLAPQNATSLGIIGAGVQARGHLVGLAGVRPWSVIKIYSRTPEKAEELATWAGEQGMPVEVVGSAKEAVADAEVICTVTSSSASVLEDADVAASGVHINAVGAFGAEWSELPPALVARSRVFVDSRESALREAGDVMVPIAEGLMTADSIVAEVGEVLAGTREGRTGDEVTVFKSLGLPIQDVVACEAIYRRAVDAGVGHQIEFP